MMSMMHIFHERPLCVYTQYWSNIHLFVPVCWLFFQMPVISSLNQESIH